jgi:hypothetical protein
MIDAGFEDVTERVIRVSILSFIPLLSTCILPFFLFVHFLMKENKENTADKPLKIPIGPWAKDPWLKELGRYEQLHMQMSVASHTPALFTRVWSWTEPQVQLLIEGVKREFRSRDLRLITSYRFITGRSPGPPSDAP